MASQNTTFASSSPTARTQYWRAKKPQHAPEAQPPLNSRLHILARKGGLQMTILSALQNSARDPPRTFTRASTANPHASAEAPYASSRSSASRHFILRLSVPQSYPSLRRTRWSIAPCTKHFKAHRIIVKKQNRCTREGILRTVPSRCSFEQRSFRSHSQCHRAISTSPLFLLYSTLVSRNSVRCCHSAVTRTAEVVRRSATAAISRTAAQLAEKIGAALEVRRKPSLA
jgi:hypothetical protein